MKHIIKKIALIAAAMMIVALPVLAEDETAATAVTVITETRIDTVQEPPAEEEPAEVETFEVKAAVEKPAEDEPVPVKAAEEKPDEVELAPVETAEEKPVEEEPSEAAGEALAEVEAGEEILIEEASAEADAAGEVFVEIEAAVEASVAEGPAEEVFVRNDDDETEEDEVIIPTICEPVAAHEPGEVENAGEEAIDRPMLGDPVAALVPKTVETKEYDPKETVYVRIHEETIDGVVRTVIETFSPLGNTQAAIREAASGDYSAGEQVAKITMGMLVDLAGSVLPPGTTVIISEKAQELIEMLYEEGVVEDVFDRTGHTWHEQVTKKAVRDVAQKIEDINHEVATAAEVTGFTLSHIGDLFAIAWKCIF